MKKSTSQTNAHHSFAHLLASAVKHLYPKATFGIGPVIEHGFYYDFDNVEIGDKDLPKIEKEMRKIAKENHVFKKGLWPVAKARAHFKKEKAPYKLELLDEIRKDTSPAKRKTLKVGMVHMGGIFLDLCRGGHVKSTGQLPLDAFKLTRVAGAYWRGDEKRPMLTRVYGIAFTNKQELVAYIEKMAETERRDHRRLGAELDLFTFSDLVGAGLPLFTPRGQSMREALTDYLWSISKKYGYEKVSIPHITKLALYETSGHAQKFKDEFFYVHGAQSGQDFVIKPMNCPHHTQIYAARPRSYRDLPLRFNEVTTQYRDEKPGELLGISRVRAATVDDAHLFCTPEQIKEEAGNIVKIIKEFYSALSMWKQGETFWVSLSVRDPKTPEKYLGDDENWNKAEKFLEEVASKYKLDAKRMVGEAAFYGPKLDFMFRDILDREWQLATIQIDFVQPERFGLEYADKDGKKKRPVMIHRAIAGSLERFMAILIEHFAGAFPFWLAPEQIWIIPISEKFTAYAKNVITLLKGSNTNLRIVLKNENETLGKKIREGGLQKIPYLLVVGEKEQKTKKVSVRHREKGNQGLSTIPEFIKHVIMKMESKK